MIAAQSIDNKYILATLRSTIMKNIEMQDNHTLVPYYNTSQHPFDDKLMVGPLFCYIPRKTGNHQCKQLPTNNR